MDGCDAAGGNYVLLETRGGNGNTIAVIQFRTASVDQGIVDAAAALYRRWRPPHGLDINDAILAATVMQTGGRIFCLNTKHYPMPGLLVKKSW